MIAYGLVDREARLTEFAEKLYALLDDVGKLSVELRRHILLNRHGITLVQWVQDIQAAALEALAFKLMRLLDMDYVATRLRGSATGGAEVDLVFQSARLVFSRWQIQCKNTPRISLRTPQLPDFSLIPI